jgi:hypothetical protein
MPKEIQGALTLNVMPGQYIQGASGMRREPIG